MTRHSRRLEQEIGTEQDKMLNADRFLSIVDQYTDIQELTPEIVREFVEKILCVQLFLQKSGCTVLPLVHPG